MFDFLFENYEEHVFQQTICIPMKTNCAPLLVYLFLYSYEANFIQDILRNNEK